MQTARKVTEVTNNPVLAEVLEEIAVEPGEPQPTAWYNWGNWANWGNWGNWGNYSRKP